MRISVRLPLLAAALVMVVAAGCRHKQSNEPSVATPSLSLSKDRVPIGSAVTLTYKFQVAPNASFDKNYYVFVHVLDPEGEQMWNDDHLPAGADQPVEARSDGRVQAGPFSFPTIPI